MKDKPFIDTNIFLYVFCTKDKRRQQIAQKLILDKSTSLINNRSILYSEDIQHRQIIESKLTIINPFIQK